MFNLLIINILLIIIFLSLIKKMISNTYLFVIIAYFSIIAFNVSIFIYKQKFDLDLMWLNFSILTFLFTIYTWIYGIITKSVSIKILVFLSKSKNKHSIKEITDNIVKNEFDKRIRILKENKLVNSQKEFFQIKKDGIRKMNVILKLRKFYNIHKKNFYF
tara:strand:+ start:2358 stop:2837 length:480 start_codon:yes stop_codon:yes gene_type:complete